MSGRTKKKLKNMMLTVKSTLDGIGTAAGVSWPLFGILSSSLSFGIGDLATIGLGSLCSIVFLTVSIPIFYIMYQNNKKKKMQLMHKLTIINSTIHLLQENYLKEKNDNIPDFRSYLQQLLEQLSKNNHEKISLDLIKFLLTHYSSFVTDDQFTHNKKKIKQFMLAFVSQAPAAPPLQHLVTTFFISFAGVFGSIAGCSSGVMGLLIGLGIASGFHTVPLIGLAILTTAIVAGLCMAIKSVETEREECQKKEVYKGIKVFHQELGGHLLVSQKKLHNKEKKRSNHLNDKNHAKSNSPLSPRNSLPLSLFQGKGSKNDMASTEEQQSLLSPANSHGM